MNKIIKLRPTLFFRFIMPVMALLLSIDMQAGAQQASRVIRIDNPLNRTVTEIDLPDSLYPKKKTLLIFFALPNGNSIEWTRGKKMQPGDDWHFDIQHIGAQTAWLRQVMKGHNILVAYMANHLKSWPAWKRQHASGPAEIKRLVDSISGSFAAYRPEIILNSHSGGGSFIFGYLDATDHIPETIRRIAFIDSNYGYEDSLHTGKLVRWLSAGKNRLSILAYNDSVVIYNGKPLVSPTGGTWYRTQWMQRQLAKHFRFKKSEDTAFINYSALSNRIDIHLKTNTEGKIYHTEQVARNGFIHTVISGSSYARKTTYEYWGPSVYERFIQ